MANLNNSERESKPGRDISYCLDANYAKGTNTTEKSRRQLVMETHTIAYSKSHRDSGLIQARGKINDEANTLSTGDGCTNQSTGNYVFTKGESVKLVNDNIYDDYNSKFRDDGVAGTLTCNIGVSAPRNGQKLIIDDNSIIRIRKLVPLECERLMSWPSYKFNMEIKLCLDRAKYYVDAVNKCPKLLKYVGNAERSLLIKNALVELSSRVDYPQGEDTVVSPAVINTPKKESLLPQESNSNVNSAEKLKSKESLKFEGDSADISVRLNIIEGKITLDGKVDTPPLETLTQVRSSGKYVLDIYGNEIMQLVKDAEQGLETEFKNHSIFTISDHLDTDSSYLSLAILYYFARNAITGYIPQEMSNRNISLTMDFINGHTKFGTLPDGKVYELSDSARYKACGNGIVSNIPKVLLDHVTGSEQGLRVFSTFAGVDGSGLYLSEPKYVKVGFAEFDPKTKIQHSANVLRYHYPNVPNLGDITKIDVKDVPDHDIIFISAPCQSFSAAGRNMGVEDTRGTLFYETARIMQAKKPKYFIFENVKGLLSKKHERTFEIMCEVYSSLGYEIDFELINAKHYGVAQNRERVFMIGKLK